MAGIPITTEQIAHWFTHHAPRDQAQVEAYKEIREAGAVLAHTINRLAPDCADKTHAIRVIRDACMWANSAIANEGK